MPINMSPYQQVDLRRMRALGVRTTDFTGRWHERHPWSSPGPIYATTFNTLSLAALAADASGLVLFDDRGEFIWRPPMTLSEHDQLLVAASKDDAMSYQIDGDSRWSSQGVAEWARLQLPQLLHWASDPATQSHLVANGSGFLDVAGSRRRLGELIAYYESRGARDLENYSRGLASGA